MKTTDSTSRINGLHIMEVSIDGTKPYNQMMTATYALLRQADNNVETHGKCKAFTTNWSEKTQQKLAELIDSMEEDLLPRHFDIPGKETSHGEGIAYREEEGSAQV